MVQKDFPVRPLLGVPSRHNTSSTSTDSMTHYCPVCARTLTHTHTTLSSPPPPQ